MDSSDFKNFTKAEKLLIVHLFITIIKGEQLSIKQNVIWNYLPIFGLTLDDFEKHIAITSKNTFELGFRSMDKKKIDIIINHIHLLMTSEPKAKTMEYFIPIQLFEKITLTSKKYFIELLDNKGIINAYPDFKTLKNT